MEALVNRPDFSALSTTEKYESYVTVRVGGQLIGISVLTVQDVMRQLGIAKVPLSPREIAGLLNLRGRIVTVIDMRVRLNLPAHKLDDKSVMHVVVEYHDELFSLMVDSIGDVLNLPASKIEKVPANLEAHWRDVALGVSRLSGELLIILDVQSLLTF